MEIILLERVARLGQMGDKVTVKDGYARNFLLPKGKALRATKANAARFEQDRVHLEARNLERKTEAEAVAKKLDGNSYIAIRSAGETGQLYGSVATRDVAALLEENGFSVGRNQIELAGPIKTIGLHNIKITLHPEVEAGISVNVARSIDEAKRQATGEDLTLRDAFDDDDAEEGLAPEEVFDNPEDVDLDGDDADDANEEQLADAEAAEDVAEVTDEAAEATEEVVEATEEAAEEVAKEATEDKPA